MTAPPRWGLILFGHGARDPRWADTMRALARRIGERAPHVPVELAFLEFLEPALPQATERLVADGVARIVVAPVFLAGGGHVLRDLPALIAQAQAANPAVSIDVLDAIGSADPVIDAMADVCLRHARGDA